ncbi:MAG: hypothetical protein PHC54_06600 [Candidatus Omnitrophica bacterium]|nr:hypothetical protein [Candidatus Omnitrophota bacterium]MDD5592811.1 hypothetical protein [Candidatus Omnitrophota bacterium]
MNIFVGNLAFEAKEADVYKLFMGFGRVASVSIVMDKKGKNSRGFAFLEMPEEEEAQAAITALNKKVFMARPINVEPARSKIEAGRDSRNIDSGSKNQAALGFNPGLKRTGRYKQGRRTLSFLKKRAQAGIEGPVVSPKKHLDNPMRWRKKREQLKAWQRKQEESKPWQKSQGGPKPWRKTEGEPRHKSQGEAKPWRKIKKNQASTGSKRFKGPAHEKK